MGGPVIGITVRAHGKQVVVAREKSGGGEEHAFGGEEGEGQMTKGKPTTGDSSGSGTAR